jgi:hypothetical protein
MESLHDDDQAVTDRIYRTIVRAVAYVRPGSAALVALDIGHLLIGRAADVPGWVAWIDEGDVIGYLRLDELEPVDAFHQDL